MKSDRHQPGLLDLSGKAGERRQNCFQEVSKQRRLMFFSERNKGDSSKLDKLSNLLKYIGVASELSAESPSGGMRASRAIFR